MESKQLIGLIYQCMTLQDTMNSVVDKNWRELNRDWTLAATMEMCEYIDHIGWKWWKHQEPNHDQAFIELVDIFHFLLSKLIEDNKPGFVQEIVESMNLYKIESISTKENAIYYAKKFIEKIKEFEAEYNEFSVSKYFYAVSLNLLFALAEYSNKTKEMFFEAYISKNVLNIFRQNNGYKDGTYIKIWNGLEDNEVMMRLITENPSLATDSDKLYFSLETEYNKIFNTLNLD